MWVKKIQKWYSWKFWENARIISHWSQIKSFFTALHCCYLWALLWDIFSLGSNFQAISDQRIHFWNPRTVMIKHRDTSFYATDSATITCRLNSLKSYRLRVSSRTPSPGITPACGSPIHEAQSLCFKAALFNEINGQVSRWSPLAPCFRITWSAC